MTRNRTKLAITAFEQNAQENVNGDDDQDQDHKRKCRPYMEKVQYAMYGGRPVGSIRTKSSEPYMEQVQ